MDPSGQGLQGYTPPLGMEDYLHQKEELRKLKAVIDAAERSMDLQMVGQMHQPIMATVPHQAVAPTPYIYPPGSLPALSLQFPSMSFPTTQETARIVEVDDGSPPFQALNGIVSNATSLNMVPETQALQQEYSQPGPSNYVYTGSSNVFPQAGPSNQNSSQAPSYMNSAHFGPVQSSSGQHIRTSTSVRPRDVDHGPPYQSSQAHSQVNNAASSKYYSPYVKQQNVSRPPPPPSQKAPTSVIQTNLRVKTPGQSIREPQTSRRSTRNRITDTNGFEHQQSNPDIPMAPVLRPGSSNDIALTPGSGPAQPIPQTSTNSKVPIQSNPAASAVEQTKVNAVGMRQSSALSTLNELLAGHEQWSEEATNRILKQALEGANSRPSRVSSSGLQADDGIIENQRSTQPNGVSPVSPQVSSAQSKSGAHPQVPVMNTPPPPPAKTYETSTTIGKDDHVETRKRPPPPPKSITDSSQPRTPGRPHKARPSTPPSSSADRTTLAKDVIRALLPPSTKRKRDDLDGRQKDDIPADSPTAKRNKLLISGDTSASGKATNGVASSQGAMASSTPGPSQQFTGIPRPSGSQTAPQQQPLWQMRYNPSPQGPHPTQPTYVTSTQSPNGERRFHSQSLVQPHPPADLRQTPTATHRQSLATPGVFYPNPHIFFPPSANPGSPWPQRVQGPSPMPQGSSQQVPQQKPTAINEDASKNASSSKRSSLSGVPIPSPEKPAVIRKKSLVPPKVVISKPPLFLPSSESPPNTPLLTGASPPNSEPAVEVKKATVVGTSSAAKLDDPNSGPLFGVPTGVLAAASVRKRAGVRPSGSEVYVLLPEIDTSAWLSSRRPKKQQADAQPNRSGADIPSYYDDRYTDLVKDFSRRMIRRPCLWKNCHAVLDSGEKLLKHVRIVHGKEKVLNLYGCRWKDCQSNRAFAESERLIQHVKWHVESRIYCGYDDCEFQTQLPYQLSKHIVLTHDESARLRHYAIPVHLVEPNVPTLLDDITPTFMSVPIPVTSCSISRERHQRIGPAILNRIFGRVSIKKGAVNAAVPLRSQRLLEKQPTYDDPPRQHYSPQDDYEFLKKEGISKRFAPLAPLPLLSIDDIEITEEIGRNIDSTQPSRPETPVYVDTVDIPRVSDENAREKSPDLPPGSAGSVTEEPRGAVMSPVQDADEVEGLL